MKAFTDIEQSKKLAEILPLESADMRIGNESIIKDLEEFVKSQGEKVPDIIPKSYQTHGSIEINIPYFEHGKFADKGARVYHISYPAALRVLKNHVKHLKKEIKQMNEKLQKGGNDE